MNFEFPFQELPAVMRGPRVERRRVLIGGSAFWGTMQDEATLVLDDGRRIDAATASYLPPVNPSKIIAVHISYTSRSIETRNKPKPTDTPTYFTKPPTSLNGHGGQILKPADCQYLNYEGEYAVVIGRTCRNVTPDEAWDLHRRLLPGARHGPAGLPRHRPGQHAAGQGRRHPAAHRPGHRARRQPVRADACAPTSMAWWCRRRTSATRRSGARTM